LSVAICAMDGRTGNRGNGHAVRARARLPGEIGLDEDAVLFAQVTCGRGDHRPVVYDDAPVRVHRLAHVVLAHEFDRCLDRCWWRRWRSHGGCAGWGAGGGRVRWLRCRRWGGLLWRR